MDTRTLSRQIGTVLLACLTATSITLTGCDEATTGPDASTRTVEGKVTDDEGYGKRAGSVEGATVTAVSVNAGGETSVLDGSATTDASGRYELQVSGATETMIVRAEGENDFAASTLVEADAEGSGTISAMTINEETEAEADVFVEARQSGASAVTESDVALYVDSELAGRIETGATTTAEVAQSIRAQVETAESYVRENSDSGDEKADQGHSNRASAFAQLEAQLSGDTDAEAEAEAMAQLEQTFADAYTEAGVSARTSARARLAAHGAVELRTGSAQDSADALFALRKRSQIVAAAGLARAIEASFQAHGAAESRLQTLADARAKLIADLRAATTADAMASAKSEFASTVQTELASELDVSSSTIDSAASASSSAKSTLDSAISISASGEAVASAYATFFGEARSAIESNLSSSANAALGAEVLAMLSVA